MPTIKFRSFQFADNQVAIAVEQDGIEIATYSLSVFDRDNRISVEVGETITDLDDPESEGYETYPLTTFCTLDEFEKLGHASRDRMIATGEHLRDLARENG